MLTVVTWLWDGWRKGWYTAEHVNTHARMLRANLTLPHRVVCVTDMPKGITECETFPLWPEPRNLKTATRPNCWRRLRLFDPSLAEQLGERILSIDLDCAIVRDMTPLLDTAEPFKICRGYYAPYNGSMWLMDAGVHPHVWTNFHPDKSPRMARVARHPDRPGARMVGSDQVWLSMQIANAATWERTDGVLNYARHSVGYRQAQLARIWFFAGPVKPWSAECRRVLPKAHAAYMDHWRGKKSPERHKK